MPEGPEVRRILDILRYYIVGALLLGIDIDKNYSEYNILSNEYNRIEHLFPCEITDVLSVGKQIFIILSNNYILNSFLSITGHWLYNKKLDHNRLTLVFENFNFYFDDAIKYGKLNIINSNQMNKKILDYRFDFMNIISPQIHLKKETLDILGNTFFDRITPDIFFDIIKTSSKRCPNKEIAKFLLDQKKISGIGNYIRSELLYKAKISPFKKLSDITKENSDNIYFATIDIMKDSYIKNGLTLKNYINPDFEKGNYIPLVYGKENQKDHYGYKIKISKLEPDRNIYFVEEIQNN